MGKKREVREKRLDRRSDGMGAGARQTSLQEHRTGAKKLPFLRAAVFRRGCTIARMGERLRRWWPVLKALLGVAILLAIGRQFWRDLRNHPEVLQRPMHLGWLLLSGALYLLGLG